MSFHQFHGAMWLYELAVLATVFIGGEGQQNFVMMLTDSRDR